MLTISNRGDGKNSLDKLLLATTEEINDYFARASSMLDEWNGRLIYIVNGVQFPYELPATWFISQDSEGLSVSRILFLQAEDLPGSSEIVYDSDAFGEKARRSYKPGFISFGPYTKKLQSNMNYTVYFRLKVSNNTMSEIIGWIDVYKSNDSEVITRRFIRPSDFNSANKYQIFQLKFTTPNNHGELEFRVYLEKNITDLYVDWIYVCPDERMTLGRDIYFPKEGNYTFLIRSPLIPSIISKGIFVDDKFYDQVEEITSGFYYIKVQNIKKGTHKIEIDFPALYSISIYPDEEKPDSYISKGTWNIIYKRVSLTEYHVCLNTSIPLFVVLSESYHPFWYAQVEGNTLFHFPIYSIANGFFIPEPGMYVIVIRYRGQYLYYCSLIVLCLYVVGLIATNWYLSRKIRKL